MAAPREFPCQDCGEPVLETEALGHYNADKGEHDCQCSDCYGNKLAADQEGDA